MALALVGILSVWLTSGAHADDVRWFSDDSPEAPTLIYGTQDSGYAALAFTCDQSAGDVIFTYEFAPADAKDGMQTNVFLSSAGGEAVLSAVGQHLEIDSLFILEAATKLDADLIKVITARGLLSVKVDRSRAVPTRRGSRSVRRPDRGMRAIAAYVPDIQSMTDDKTNEQMMDIVKDSNGAKLSGGADL